MNNFLIKSNYRNLDNAIDNLFKPLFFDEKIDYMKTDIIEDKDGYTLDIELPGFSKENIAISLEDEYLTVSAKREEVEHPDSKFLRKERSINCCRSYYVADINESDIKASYTNGVLSIHLPKEEPQKPQKRTIEIE